MDAHFSGTFTVSNSSFKRIEGRNDERLRNNGKRKKTCENREKERKNAKIEENNMELCKHE
jgi:hypothetical protein